MPIPGLTAMIGETSRRKVLPDAFVREGGAA